MDIKLVPLTVADREQFILDNQQAFKYGAQKEFGMRDDRMEEGEEVISRKTIERCLDDNQADYCFLMCNFSLLSGAPKEYLFEFQQDTYFYTFNVIIVIASPILEKHAKKDYFCKIK